MMDAPSQAAAAAAAAAATAAAAAARQGSTTTQRASDGGGDETSAAATAPVPAPVLPHSESPNDGAGDGDGVSSSWPPGGRIEIRWGSAASRGARAAMEDAHVGVVDVCEHFGVELCSGCGVGGGGRGAGGAAGGESRGGGERASSSGGAPAPAPAPSGLSFFGVFDGHGGGGAAAAFAASRLLDLVVAPGRQALAADPAAAMRAAFGRLDLEFYRHATANAAAAAAAADEDASAGAAASPDEGKEGGGGGATEDAAAAEEEAGRGGEASGGGGGGRAPASSTADLLHDCGSTVLAALLCGTTLVLANAGDSRAVLCSRTGGKSSSGGGSNGNGNGTAAAASSSSPSTSTSTFRQLTVDHKPSLASERARIEAAGGRVCREGFLNSVLGVARAIGDFSPPEADGLKWLAADGESLAGPLTSAPDVLELAVTERDEFLLVACDGLWDVLPTARAVELARQGLRASGGCPARAAAALVEHALGLHASDNVTALLLCFGPPLPRRRRSEPSAAADAAGAVAAAAVGAAADAAPPRPSASSSSSSSSLARPARSLSRNSLSTLSDALASCERGGAATGRGPATAAAAATTAAAAALLLPPLAPLPPQPAIVVAAGDRRPGGVGGGSSGGGGGGAKRVVPSSPAFLLGGRSRSQSGDGGAGGVGGRPR